jgi:hypothetical protein
MHTFYVKGGHNFDLAATYDLQTNQCMYFCSIIDIRTLTLISRGEQAPPSISSDKGGEKGRGFMKSKKDTKSNQRDDTEEDPSDQSEVPVVRDNATRGVSKYSICKICHLSNYWNQCLSYMSQEGNRLQTTACC